MRTKDYKGSTKNMKQIDFNLVCEVTVTFSGPFPAQLYPIQHVNGPVKIVPFGTQDLTTRISVSHVPCIPTCFMLHHLAFSNFKNDT